MKKRTVLGALVGGFSVTNADADRLDHLKAVWVRLSQKGIAVETEPVALAELDAAVMRHGRAVNPARTDEEIRRRMRIYIQASPGVSFDRVRDAIGTLSRYERIGIVGEDAR